MKNSLLLLGAALILGLSFVSGCLIISNEWSATSEKAMETRILQLQTEAKTQADLAANAVIDPSGSPLMTLAEAGQFLHLSEEQVLNIIKAEHAVLSNYGQVVGLMLPYIKVDDQFMINRAELLNWVKQATLEKRVYSGVTMTK
jgi:hypothetical protein